MNAEREFFRPVVEAGIGIAAWLNGGFAIAREQLEAATAEFVAAGHHTLEALWFAPTDPMTMAHGILSLDRLAGGDLRGAEAQALQAAHRADELSFPQGPFSLAFARFFEIWIASRRASSIALPRSPPSWSTTPIGTASKCGRCGARSASHRRRHAFDLRRRRADLLSAQVTARPKS